MNRIWLFITGFLQLFLIAINTWQIANEKLWTAMIVCFMISLTATLNIKALAFGSWADRLVYCFGSTLGCGAGIWLVPFLYR